MKIKFVHYDKNNVFSEIETIDTDSKTLEEFLMSICPCGLTFKKQCNYYIFGHKFSYGFEPNGEKIKVISID